MYNPLVSYEENLRRGPAPEWNRGGQIPRILFRGTPRFSILDVPLHLPLGIPAGPLLSAAFVQVASNAGFCMPVYKTVRSRAWQSHPWPNVLQLIRVEQTQVSSCRELEAARSENQPKAIDANLWNSSVEGEQRSCVQVIPLSNETVHDSLQVRRLSITNAFGVPSLAPQEWTADFQRLSSADFSSGQMSVLSFQGSRESGGRWQDFLLDTAKTASLAADCVQRKNGRILEMNVSCPNESGAPIYTDLNALTETLRAAAEGMSGYPGIKLIVKLGVVAEDKILPTVELVSRYAHGISAINTVTATIVKPDGSRALGSGAEHGGVCGHVIREQALWMIERLHRARVSLGLQASNFALIGVGGCSSPADVQKFLAAGADVVHAATGAMWNLQLASECAIALGVDFDYVTGDVDDR